MIKRGLSLLVSKPDFRLLMAVQFAAQAGDGIVQTALAKFIVFGGRPGFDLDAAPPEKLLGMVLLVFVPYTVLSPFLGVVIDRWERRRLLFVANGLRALAVVIVALVGVTNVPNGVLLTVLLLTLASTRVVLATKAAALPTTLGGSDLQEGNGISQFGGALFQLGGGGVALVGVAVLSPGPVAIVGAVVYAVGALLALRIGRAGEARQASTLAAEIARVITNIVAGLREVVGRPQAGVAITTYFWLRLLWTLSILGIGLVVKDLIVGDKIARLLLTAGGGAVGAGLGFVFAGVLRKRAKGTARLVLAASALTGIATAVLGGLQLKAAIVLLTFFLGFGFFLAKISLDTLVQEALGDDFRGRAFSLYDIAYNIAWVIAAGAMRLWWDGMGSGLIAAMGIVFLIGMAGIAAWFRRTGLLAVAGV